MRKPALLVTMSLAATAIVLVAGPASASPSRSKPKTSTSSLSSTKSLAARYSVINGTANATSDHEIVGSSAFPNYATGAVDNYYSKAHSHVDNSPFAEGTASPADTGPIGQTAAAGNFQQPQYADARWPGDSGKATYGNQGGPYAVAGASKYLATADASEASNGLSGPGGPGLPTLAVPKGFDGRLRLALAAWKATWQDRLNPKKPSSKITAPTVTVKTPTATVPTPVVTVTTPTVTGGGVTPTPPVTPPSLPAPRRSARATTTPSRSLASLSTSTSGDGESLLESSTRATVDPKTHKLVTSGESRLGRVSLGGGQIVIEGIHVSATITNGGTRGHKVDIAHKVVISVAAASIGGVPVTIDQDGVHVAGQGQALPFQQASDALNGALKQAGIKIFLVAPEITNGDSCGQGGPGTSTGGGGNGTTTTTSKDQSGTTSTSSSCGQSSSCDQSGTGTTTTPLPATTPTSTGSSCAQPTSCDQTSTATGATPTTTTTTTSSRTGTTPTTSSCDQTGMTTPTSSCARTGTSPNPTGSNNQTGTTTSPTGSSDQTGIFSLGTSNSGEEIVRATGVHLVFTQPVSQSGVPAQNIEHILGDVFLDSLAVPAPRLPKLSLNLNLKLSSCLGGASGGANTSSGLSSAGGSTSSSSPSGFSSSSTGSQPTSSTAGSALPTRLASMLRKKPLWVLIAFLLWQTLSLGAAASLWNWRKEGTA